MSLRAALLCCAVPLAAAGRLRAPGNATNGSLGTHNTTAHNASQHNVSSNATHGITMHNLSSNATQHNTSAHPNLTDAEKVQKLQQGLKAIQGVQALFADRSSHSVRAAGADKFAEGALSEELSSKDSAVWAVIGAMVNSTQKVMAEMKGKSQDQQKKIMESLETELDSKAGVLRNVTNEAGKRQVVQDEEYVLGLLNMHARDWPMEEQLETVQKFMGNSPKLAALYKHHNASQPLAMQLAALMDSKVVARMFIQLASDLH